MSVLLFVLLAAVLQVKKQLTPKHADKHRHEDSIRGTNNGNDGEMIEMTDITSQAKVNVIIKIRILQSVWLLHRVVLV